MDTKLKQGVSLVLLAYKEEENLRALFPDIIGNIDKCGCEYELVVVDTARPTDNTKAVCEKYGARYINQEEPYFAGAFKTAIKYASFDKFLIMDSDGSHPPMFIPDIYNKFMKEDLDVVVGSRYIEGGVSDDAVSSRVMSHILNTVFRVALGINAKDLSTDYRMYRTADLKKCELKCKYYDVLEEVLLLIKLDKPKHKLAIGETPIHFDKRKYGSSKRQLVKFVINYGLTLIRLIGVRISANFKRQG